VAHHRLLGPHLPAFLRAYPEVELDLDYNDAVVDVIDDGFDVVIRSGALADSRLMSRRLASYRLLVVGAPRYLRRHRAPRRPSELAGHACLGYRFPSSGKLQPWALITDEPFTLGPGMICNSGDALLAAAVQGLGLASLPDFGVRDELARGGLVSVLDDFASAPGVFHALWPANRLLSPKVRVFVEHLTARGQSERRKSSTAC
jgi:DNA-binding transcriptional LysR family regulator